MILHSRAICHHLVPWRLYTPEMKLSTGRFQRHIPKLAPNLKTGMGSGFLGSYVVVVPFLILGLKNPKNFIFWLKFSRPLPYWNLGPNWRNVCILYLIVITKFFSKFFTPLPYFTRQPNLWLKWDWFHDQPVSKFSKDRIVSKVKKWLKKSISITSLKNKWKRRIEESTKHLAAGNWTLLD